MNTIHDIEAISSQFCFEGSLKSFGPIGNGHINDTFLLEFIDIESKISKYILQRINHEVFEKPLELMENIVKVTQHIRTKILQNGGNVMRECLTLIKTHDEKFVYKDRQGNYWRAFYFIEHAISHQSVSSPDLFYETARAFGKFQNLLSDFPADCLFETIPGFHDTAKRFDALLQMIEKDPCGRRVKAQNEVDFALARHEEAKILVDLLHQQKLPLKVTHNDTKLNNVLMDEKTGQGICVIDLDTVMPGLSLYDFGDAVRGGSCTADEDEMDLSKVDFSLELFEAFAKGFLEETGDSLTKLEKKYLPFSAKIISLELGVRFLTDYLSGDTYFKTYRQGQNLDRCKVQFKLVKEIEEKMHRMQEIVEKYS